MRLLRRPAPHRVNRDSARGSMSITFDEALALEIMQNMLGERPNGLNEEVTDMVG